MRSRVVRVGHCLLSATLFSGIACRPGATSPMRLLLYRETDQGLADARTAPAGAPVRSGFDYVGVTVESAHLPLPGTDRPLALVLQIEGELPQGSSWRAVLGLAPAAASDDRVAGRTWRVDRPGLAQPIPYRGGRLEIHLFLVPVSDADALRIMEARQARWGEVRHADPAMVPPDADDFVEPQGAPVASLILGKAGTPAVTTGRYLLALGTAGKDARWMLDQRSRPVRFGGRDPMPGPFAVLNLTRHSRGPPRPWSVFRVSLRRVDRMLELAGPEATLMAADEAQRALAQDRTLTDRERKMNSVVLEGRRSRARALQALRSGQLELMRELNKRERETQIALKDGFDDILSSAQKSEIDHRLRELDDLLARPLPGVSGGGGSP